MTTDIIGDLESVNLPLKKTIKEKRIRIEEEIGRKRFEFTNINDLMITEVVLDHYLDELESLKQTIFILSQYSSELKSGMNSEFYKRKKKLIADYIKCSNMQEKEFLKEKLNFWSTTNSYSSNIDRANEIIVDNLKYVINEAKESLKEWDLMQQLSCTSQSIDRVQSQASILIPLNQHGMNSPEISSTTIPGVPNLNLETNDLTTQNLPNGNITLAQTIGLKYRKKTVEPKSKKLTISSILSGSKQSYFSKSTTWHNCEICQKKFTHKKILKDHFNLMHGSINQEPTPRDNKDELLNGSDKNLFKCRICEKTFKKRGILTNHERIHTGVKQHKCNICGKGFNRRNNLKRHENVHKEIYNSLDQGNKIYKCKYCESGFSQRGHFMIHLRTHKDEKSFCCKFCDKKFHTNASKNFHEKTHTEHMPFSCKMCEKSFLRSCDLKIHEKTHNITKAPKIPKLYKCKYCGKTFNRCFNLNRHELTHIGKSNSKLAWQIETEELSQSSSYFNGINELSCLEIKQESDY